ncbi:hypothetical protein AZE42_14160, partial [Rhizopogon vesiculosus]
MRKSSGTSSTGANSDPEKLKQEKRNGLCGFLDGMQSLLHALLFPRPEEYRGIGVCGLLLGMQSLLQMLLIPQGKLFGQIMFLLSFIISWAYN